MENESTGKFFFSCPECGYDSDEAEYLCGPNVKYCGLCAGDNGRDVCIDKREATRKEVEDFGKRLIG